MKRRVIAFVSLLLALFLIGFTLKENVLVNFSERPVNLLEKPIEDTRENFEGVL